MNNICHSAYFKIKPEMVGPTAGPKPITSPVIPIAIPRFSGGNRIKMTF